jgi:hypothetical protein
VCSLAIGYSYLDDLCGLATDKFAISKISTNYNFAKKWEFPPPDAEMHKEIHRLLSQKFTYLDRGGQSFAFLSEDKTTVLKFPKQYLRPPLTWLVPICNALHIKFEPIEHRIFVRNRDYQSYAIAYEHLKEDTGLIYLHLDPTQHTFGKILIVDKLGIEHRVDLDSRDFILQKRADMLYPYFEKLIEEGDIERAKRTIDALTKLITLRNHKGIEDSDAKMRKNFGIFDGKVGFIDLGKFSMNPSVKEPAAIAKDLRLTMLSLQRWLSQSIPLLSDYIEGRLAAFDSALLNQKDDLQ